MRDGGEDLVLEAVGRLGLGARGLLARELDFELFLEGAQLLLGPPALCDLGL